MGINLRRHNQAVPRELLHLLKGRPRLQRYGHRRMAERMRGQSAAVEPGGFQHCLDDPADAVR